MFRLVVLSMLIGLWIFGCGAASPTPPADVCTTCVSSSPCTSSDAGCNIPAADSGIHLIDAGVFVDAGVLDAGTDDCFQRAGLTNTGFECGQEGWTVVDGEAQTIAGGWQSKHALELAPDVSGSARLALSTPIEAEEETSLCVGLRAKGTMQVIHVDVWVNTNNVMTSFAAPLTENWEPVPLSMLRVLVPARSKAYLTFRTQDAQSNQRLQLDDINVRLTNGPCSWE